MENPNNKLLLADLYSCCFINSESSILGLARWYCV